MVSGCYSIAIKRVTGESETNTAIWLNMRKSTIRPIIQQFLYKMMHRTHLIRKYWRNINRYKEQEWCATCNKTESMNHIITHCRENTTHLIWNLAKNFWPHRNIPWPDINIGMILRCGCINIGTILGCRCINMYPERPRRNNQQQQEKRITHWGLTWLFQILLSKSVTSLRWPLLLIRYSLCKSWEPALSD